MDNALTQFQEILSHCIAHTRNLGLPVIQESIVDRCSGLCYELRIRKEVQFPIAKRLDHSLDALATPCLEDVVVDNLMGQYSLIYNHFNIINTHLLLVSHPVFLHQLEPLSPDDFEFIMVAIRAGLIVCYNGGHLSGSSQPRKHINIIERPAHFPLLHLVSESASCPYDIASVSAFDGYKHGVCMLDEDVTATQLYSLYLQLLNHCGIFFSRPLGRNLLPLSTTRPDANPETGKQWQRAPYQPNLDVDYCQIYLKDYSLVVTGEFTFLCLRESSGYMGIECNSLSFLGNFFLLSQQQRNILEEHGIVSILRGCMSKAASDATT